ncbi:MAG TPA: hypothetical protein VNY84_09515, partial [Acidimicrobiales bacterium]|nr:hypothetical protein [Acidimicrobiales bacterium]
EPGLALAAAVAAAGRRARSGRPAKHAGSAIHIIELHLEDYTNEEMWTFDLGADLVTMLSGNRRFALPPHITRKLDDRHSRKAVQEAADGPEGLRPLRSQVPHRG